MRLIALVTVLLASCAASIHPGYATDRDWTEYQSAVRVYVMCEDGSAGAGSGVTIAGRYALTARHVVTCSDGSLVTTINIVTRGHVLIQASVDYVSKTADVARLVALGTADVFTTFARPRRSAALIGERVCMIGGDDPGVYGLRKCGDVAAVLREGIVVSARIVPGNSGGPAFDTDGALVGIVSRGSWREGAEYLVGLVPVSDFGDAYVAPVPDIMMGR